MRLINDSLDSFINNLTYYLYNTKNARVVKNLKSLTMIARNGVKCVRLVKHFQIFVSNATKCMKTINVVLITWK